MRAFYDTNVLLDVLEERRPFCHDSAKAWTLAERRRLEGHVSALSFANIFYILEKTRGRTDALRALRTMLQVFTPAALDAEVIVQALDQDLPDFEDAIQYFSALRAGADFILSRNPDHFPRDPAVPVLSPTEFLARLRTE